MRRRYLYTSLQINPSEETLGYLSIFLNAKFFLLTGFSSENISDEANAHRLFVTHLGPEPAGACRSSLSATYPLWRRWKVPPRALSIWQASPKPYSSAQVFIHMQLMELDRRNDANR